MHLRLMDSIKDEICFCVMFVTSCSNVLSVFKEFVVWIFVNTPDFQPLTRCVKLDHQLWLLLNTYGMSLVIASTQTPNSS